MDNTQLSLVRSSSYKSRVSIHHKEQNTCASYLHFERADTRRCDDVKPCRKVDVTQCYNVQEQEALALSTKLEIVTEQPCVSRTQPTIPPHSHLVKRRLKGLRVPASTTAGDSRMGDTTFSAFA
jgi:hypothetical protein